MMDDKLSVVEAPATGPADAAAEIAPVATAIERLTTMNLIRTNNPLCKPGE